MSARAGMPLPALAEHYGERGWQLVPTQWHVQCPGRAGQTPVRGVTGSAPFLAAEQITARVRGLVLDREGGPECVGRHSKPAVRPPEIVVGIDVDHDYSGKTGGDTLVTTEMALGLLPATFSCTARGQYSPSRRLWFRTPADLILTDRFFAGFGADIEIVRTGHRFSWTAPAIHTKRGRIVGPVLWYDPAGTVTTMPHIDVLGELPGPWVRRGYDLMAAETTRQCAVPVDPTGRSPITETHANAIVVKLTRRLHDLPPRGGEFRAAVFGLASVVARRAAARGHPTDAAAAEVRELFTGHPQQLRTDADDETWIGEGIAAGYGTAWFFVPEPDALDIPATPITYPDEASDADLNRLVTECTGFTAPGKLGQRIAWMRADPGKPGALVGHARNMIFDVIEGHYPGVRAVQAVAQVYRDAGGRNPDAPRQIVAVALGSILRTVATG